MIAAPGAAAVVFDFDGVLADTERIHLAAFQDVFAGRAWTLDEAAYFERYLGYDDRDLVEVYAQDQGLAIDRATLDDLVQRKAARYADLLDAGTALYPQAQACVQALSERFSLAIASGSLGVEIRTILRPAGLLDAFRVIVGADDVARGKPAPDTYATAVERLGIQASRAVAVEDSPWGLESARAAGLPTVGITTSYPAPALTGAGHIITSLNELTPGLVEELVSSAPTREQS